MEVRVIKPGAALALCGRLGASTVADARAALCDAVDHGVDDLLLDLHEVELVDATGLGLLVGVHRRADRLGRRLVLQRVPERIERLLQATRLNRVLVVQRPVIDLGEAVSA
jgi:anti-anti-sigma factor